MGNFEVFTGKAIVFFRRFIVIFPDQFYFLVKTPKTIITPDGVLGCETQKMLLLKVNKLILLLFGMYSVRFYVLD